jgi:transposase
VTNNLEYIGLDLHKKIIRICCKNAAGDILEERKIGASRAELDRWLQARPGAFVVAMEATMFTGWVYDHLKPHAQRVVVLHPAMAKAITAGKHQNDGLDCRQMSDLVRVNWAPESYMAPSYIRDLRRILRYRNLLVRECTRMKNRGSGMLMECGVEYEKRKLHGRKYFRELLGELPEKVGEAGQSVPMLLELNRDALELFSKYERQLLRGLELHPELNRRVTLLRSIGGVGPVLALTWALEVGEVGRLGSIRKAVSFCGLCSGEWNSAEKNYRRPISKKRNAHLQTVLIEAAHLARLRNVQLQQVYERELQKRRQRERSHFGSSPQTGGLLNGGGP